MKDIFRKKVETYEKHISDVAIERIRKRINAVLAAEMRYGMLFCFHGYFI